MMSALKWLKREIASYFGITICNKCGTRTKIKPTKNVKRFNIDGVSTSEGYSICPKCGQKERWMSGDVGA